MSRQWRSDDTDPWVYGFGSGADGSSYVVPANEGCSGTSGGTSLTLASAGSFTNGDLVLIHQTRGTGAGNWELNKIASGAGTTSLVMVHNLQNTYADSGASQAQIIELKEYDGATISTTITAPAWDGSKGGIIAFLDKGTTTISGSIDVGGLNGGNATIGNGLGFRGGEGDYGNDDTSSDGFSGESSTGPSLAQYTANGMGGGGGHGDDKPGGGGGYATSGTNGVSTNGNPVSVGFGGGTGGNAELTTLLFGGAGGGGGEYGAAGQPWGGGGGSAGCFLIFSNNINLTGSIDATGGNGGNGDDKACGGGGAGGSCLIKCVTATLGTNKVLATGGSGGSSNGATGGNGGVGRIHIDYSGSYTGTTSPTIDARLDATIIPLSPGGSSPMFFSSGAVTIG